MSSLSPEEVVEKQGIVFSHIEQEQAEQGLTDEICQEKSLTTEAYLDRICQGVLKRHDGGGGEREPGTDMNQMKSKEAKRAHAHQSHNVDNSVKSVITKHRRGALFVSVSREFG